MNSRSSDHQNTIAVLNKLRNTYHSQLNASDLAELDEVIELLTRHEGNEDKSPSYAEHAQTVLRIIEIVLLVGTNLSDYC
ncbi:MAG: hypothetical protein VXY56_09235 [Pseudomonadota bacterium]|nr:hypothetical protein [Pseudomonadota bacterium]